MSKYGLGRGLSSLFTVYDEKKEEKKPAEKPVAKPVVAPKPVVREEPKPIVKPAPAPAKELDRTESALERAKNLLNEQRRNAMAANEAKARPIEHKALADINETVERNSYLQEKQVLQNKLAKIQETLTKPIEGDKDKVVELPVLRIEPNINQPRKNFDKESLVELSQSIKEHGIIQPIIVVPKGDKFSIVAGERRYKAAKMAGLRVVPAIIKGYSSKQVKEIALIENIQREDLNPVETAYALKQLVDDYNLTQDEVAERIGKTRSVVTNYLRILKLQPEVLSMVDKGKLSFAHAKALVVIEDREAQIKLARKASDDKISSKELEVIIQQMLNPEKVKKVKQNVGLEVKELISEMQQVFGTKVNVIGSDKRGRIYIDYYNMEDLDRIAEIIKKLS